MIRAVAAALLTSVISAAPAAAQEHYARGFMADEGEAIAHVRARCTRCDWGQTGRESVALTIAIDGKYSQTLQLVRGDVTADYPIALGHVGKGLHRLTLDRDPALSAPSAGPATIEVSDFTFYSPGGSNDYTALSMAPIVYARENTVGKFTDLPLLMWYEAVPTARGRQYRYSVIFSNEDGGTQTDRLMATRGPANRHLFGYSAQGGT